MRVEYVCMWCGDEVKPALDDHQGGEVIVSHDIWPACARKEKAEEAERLKKAEEGGKDDAGKNGG